MSLLLKLKNKKMHSSRSQIALRSVQDDVLTLPSRQSRIVLQASSLNFELKSEEEQDVIIDMYQQFLNSLSSPIQLIIRVRELDMDHYLRDFKAQYVTPTSTELEVGLIDDYSEFVSSLVKKNKILTRSFYIVVASSSTNAEEAVTREQLQLSSDIVKNGLAKLGVQTRRLSSLEILDLFYSFYSPTRAKRQPLSQQTMSLLKGALL